MRTASVNIENNTHAFLKGALLGLIVIGLTLTALTGCSKKTPEEKMMEINQYIQTGKQYQAVAAGKDFLDEHGEHPFSDMVRMMLANYFMSLEDFESAYKYLQEIYVRNDLNNVNGFQAFSAIIQTMMREGRTTESIQLAMDKISELEEATTKTEALPALKEQVSNYLVGLDRHEEARKILTDLLDNDSSPILRAMDRTRLLALSYIRTTETEKAMSVYKGLIDDRPELEQEVGEQDIIQFIEPIADNLKSAGEWDKAIEVYQTLLAKFPETKYRRNYLMGVVFYARGAGNDELADASFNEALDLMNKEIEAAEDETEIGQLVFEKCRVFEINQKLDEAVDTAHEFLKEYPEHEMAGQFLAYAMAICAHHDKFDQQKELVEFLEGKPRVMTQVLDIYVRRGLIDEGIELSALIEEKFEDKEIAEFAAKAQTELRKYKERVEKAMAEATSDTLTTTGTLTSTATITGADAVITTATLNIIPTPSATAAE